MLIVQRPEWRQRLVYSLILFVLVVIVFGCAVDTFWFREDDLGVILNGIIDSWHDFVRVFSSDCRSFITPCNYQRTVPNVFSGFLRPIQNVIFSCIYAVCGTNPWAYYLTHVAFHAANTALFFMICSVWLPINLSLVSGLLFAFYPDVSWLTWIGTVQISLMMFFLLLTSMCFYAYATEVRRAWRNTWYVLAGFFFLCSLLSREAGILLPFWFFGAAYIFLTDSQRRWRVRARRALHYTWIFFVVNGLYALIRLWAFGVYSVPRTIRNIALRYPTIAHYVQDKQHVVDTLVHRPAVVLEKIHSFTATTQSQSFFDGFISQFASWFQALGNMTLADQWQRWTVFAIVMLVVMFVCAAFYYHRGILVWLLFGLVCMTWPGVLTYPTARYVSGAYPFIIFIGMYAIYAAHRYLNSFFMRFTSLVALGIAVWFTGRGALKNYYGLKQTASQRVAYKQRFDDFLGRCQFDPATRFVVISSPFVPDIQSVFQSYCHSRDTQVVCDPFATLAEFGCMGCRKAYRTTAVASQVQAIPGGFRLQSCDEHCGWWLRFSEFPIAWSAKDGAYEWTSVPYQEGVWYDCSVGKFKINVLADADCASDISFVFDRRWIDEWTVFIAWNTQVGRYYVVPRHKDL